jgi:hypothetical protein
VNESAKALGSLAHQALIEHVVAVIVLAGTDAADVVLDAREELSIRWHPLRTTSPNIGATVRVVAGDLSTADLVAAGAANRVRSRRSSGSAGR